MTYIASNDIYMFPVANRGDAFPLSRLTTEQNIVNILKSMSDKDGFVISPSGSVDMDSSALFEFIIGGYYVKTTNNKLPDDDLGENAGDILYACLKIASYGSTIADGNQEILSQNASSSYGPVNDDGTIDMNSVQFDNSLDDDPTPTDFYGISFEWEDSSTTPTGYTKILPILYYDGANYIVKEEYRYKIDRNSIDDQWIDLT